MNGYLHESLAGMRVTEAFVREDENQETFENVGNDIRHTWMRAIHINNAFWPALDFTGTIGTVLVYYFGVKFMGAEVHPLTLANLLLMMWYLGRFWEPLNALSNFYNSVLSAMASMDRMRPPATMASGVSTATAFFSSLPAKYAIFTLSSPMSKPISFPMSEPPLSS